MRKFCRNIYFNLKDCFSIWKTETSWTEIQQFPHSLHGELISKSWIWNKSSCILTKHEGLKFQSFDLREWRCKLATFIKWIQNHLFPWDRSKQFPSLNYCLTGLLKSHWFHISHNHRANLTDCMIYICMMYSIYWWFTDCNECSIHADFADIRVFWVKRVQVKEKYQCWFCRFHVSHALISLLFSMVIDLWMLIKMELKIYRVSYSNFLHLKWSILGGVGGGGWWVLLLGDVWNHQKQ